jgi:hypothetical protein
VGGLVLDHIIAYLLKSSMDFWGHRGSSRWPVADAVIDAVDESRWYTVHVISITYHYDADGSVRHGCDEINFFYGSSAYEFRRKAHPGLPVGIRLNPLDAEASVIA